MNIFTSITALIKLITVYFELKNRSFYYDILERSKKHQQQIINEIETLRKSGNSGDADAADLLRNKLIQEQKYSKHLSAVYSKIGAESAD